MLESLNCRICGGELQEDGGAYKCVHCGHTFVKKAEDDYAEKLKDLLKEEKYEKVSAARQNLWAAMHEEYVNSSSCLEYARELKSLVPSDYYAGFAETANGKGEEEISRFLNRSSKGDMETYADAVLDFMIKSMTPGNLTAVCNYIDRAYPKASPEYAKYINIYEEEAEKVESGIYELTMPRDVFVVYSSKDIDKVLELTECLKEQGISCFISMRNLRHGRGAADNYDRALQTAIDNCKTIVFISSKNSRSLACDALRKEIPYIRKTDTDGAPAEYRTVAYEKIPYRYKKDRVEYLLDDYVGTAADKIVKQFFDGVEWCKTTDEVADRVIAYLTAVPETDDAPRGGNIGDEDIQKIISAVTGANDKPVSSASTDSVTSMVVKEKNVLGQIKRLISMGGFPEAKSRIDDLEKEEQSVLGVCSAAVYYYKILIGSEVDDDEKLIEKFIASDKDPASDSNFLLAKSCEDSQDKERILKIEETIESRLNEIRAEYVAPVPSQELGEVTLSGYAEERNDASVIPTSVFGYNEMPFEEKEKNVLGYVRNLIERGFFEESAKWLDETEKEEIALHGKASAAIYYYKILCENMTSSPDEVARKYTETGIDLKNNRNYILAMCSDDSPEKSKIIELDRRVEGVLRDRELYRQAEEKRKKDEEERKAKEQREAAERLERERREAAEAKRREEEERLGLKSSEGLEFEERGDGYIFTWVGTCNDTDIVIPSTFRGKPVVGIGDKAFIGCKHIKSIFIPSCVTYIGESAFEECSSLTKIKLPQGLSSISEYSFRNCSLLKGILIPDTVKGIGTSAFSGCRSLETITLPDAVKKIGSSAFSGCSSLKNINIPKGITDLKNDLFEDCGSLTAVSLPQTIITIDDRTFSGCKSLSQILIPSGIRSIGFKAFAGGNSNLKIYYLGKESDWNRISLNSDYCGTSTYNPRTYKLIRSDRIYPSIFIYSEARPRDLGKFWHYDEKGKPVEW